MFKYTLAHCWLTDEVPEDDTQTDRQTDSTDTFAGQIVSVGPASWPRGTKRRAGIGVCGPLTASFGAETMVCAPGQLRQLVSTSAACAAARRDA